MIIVRLHFLRCAKHRLHPRALTTMIVSLAWAPPLPSQRLQRVVSSFPSPHYYYYSRPRKRRSPKKNGRPPRLHLALAVSNSPSSSSPSSLFLLFFSPSSRASAPFHPPVLAAAHRHLQRGRVRRSSSLVLSAVLVLPLVMLSPTTLPTFQPWGISGLTSSSSSFPRRRSSLPV